MGQATVKTEKLVSK